MTQDFWGCLSFLNWGDSFGCNGFVDKKEFSSSKSAYNEGGRALVFKDKVVTAGGSGEKSGVITGCRECDRFVFLLKNEHNDGANQEPSSKYRIITKIQRTKFQIPPIEEMSFDNPELDKSITELVAFPILVTKCLSKLDTLFNELWMERPKDCIILLPPSAMLSSVFPRTLLNPVTYDKGHTRGILTSCWNELVWGVTDVN